MSVLNDATEAMELTAFTVLKFTAPAMISVLAASVLKLPTSAVTDVVETLVTVLTAKLIIVVEIA